MLNVRPVRAARDAFAIQKEFVSLVGADMQDERLATRGEGTSEIQENRLIIGDIRMPDPGCVVNFLPRDDSRVAIASRRRQEQPGRQIVTH